MEGSGYEVTADIAAHRPEAFTLAARTGDTSDRYRGQVEPVDPVGGHIPTAHSAPFTSNLGRDGRFRPPKELAGHFLSLGLDPDQSSLSMCGSGVTACHNILAMHLAGFAEPLLYPGWWSDWSTARFPMATGADPGDSPA